mgnify:CR=1 FL=1
MCVVAHFDYCGRFDDLAHCEALRLTLNSDCFSLAS